MCGRFVRSTPQQAIEQAFDVSPGADLGLQPQYNVCPGQDVVAVAGMREGRRLGLLRWGLVPASAKDPARGTRPINVRAESTLSKPLFRQALAMRRCVVVVDGFYEWRRDASERRAKTPYYVRFGDGEPMALAAIWSRWRAPDGARSLSTCAILTCPANERLALIHDRMPVILPRSAWGPWLDPAVDDPVRLAAALVPHPAGPLEAYAVSPLVNAPRNDSPECVRPA